MNTLLFCRFVTSSLLVALLLLFVEKPSSELFAQTKQGATKQSSKNVKSSPTNAAPAKNDEKNSSKSKSSAVPKGTSVTATTGTTSTGTSSTGAAGQAPAATNVAAPVTGSGSESKTLGANVVSAKPFARSPKRPAKPWQFSSEELRISTTTGSLYGTLVVPTNATTTASVPVLLILSTSTVYDRNGVSTYQQDSGNAAKYLAEALAKEGIAVLRYDTRAVGKSIGAFIGETYHDFERTISDACIWVDTLRKDKRLGAVTVMGFSRPNDFGREAALAGIVTAWRKQTEGLIFVGAESRPWLKFIRSQAYMTYPEQTAKEVDSVAALLENGMRPKLSNKDGILFDLMRPTLQPYILSLNKYNPVEEIAKLSIPIIGIHGTLDFSIAEEHTKNLVAVNQNAKYFSIPNMSFNLKDGNKDLSTPAKEKGKLPVLPELVDLFANFIHGVEKQQP